MTDAVATLRARHLLTELSRRAADAADPAYGQYGTVTAVSGDLIAVKLAGDTVDGSQLIARAAGPKLAIGDPVGIMPMLGGSSIAIKIGGDEIAWPYAGKIQLTGDSANLILIEAGDGTDIFSVQTLAAPEARLENGTAIKGYADGAQADTNWQVDAAGGLHLYKSGVFVGPNDTPLRGGHIQGGRAVYLTNEIPTGALAGVTLTANRVYYVPVFMGKGIACSGFVFEVTTAVSGSVQCGLYEDSGNFLPTTRLVLGTKTSVTTIGFKSLTQTVVNIANGRWYWVALCSTTAMAIRGSSTAQNLPSLRGGEDASGSRYLMASEDLTAGWTNLPTTASPGSNNNLYLHVGALN